MRLLVNALKVVVCHATPCPLLIEIVKYWIDMVSQVGVDMYIYNIANFYF